MHKQLMIPGFPDGAQRIGEAVSIVEKDGWVSYFVGGDDYFRHTKEDVRSRRFILTTLMENKHLKAGDLSSQMCIRDSGGPGPRHCPAPLCHH